MITLSFKRILELVRRKCKRKDRRQHTHPSDTRYEAKVAQQNGIENELKKIHFFELSLPGL